MAERPSLPLSCWLAATLIAGAGCSFDHLRYKTPSLTAGGQNVAVLELGAQAPADCTFIRHTTTNNIQGDPSYMRIKLQNSAANYGGNLLLLTTFNRLTSEGAVYDCPPSALPAVATAPTAAASATSTVDEPPAPPAAPATATDAASADAPQSRPIVDNDSLDAEARGIFLAGKAAYGDARYEDALGHFKRAYELSKRPVLLFNIGQAADKLRRDREALEAFEAYLAQVPNGEGVREAESRVRVLSGVVKGK